MIVNKRYRNDEFVYNQQPCLNENFQLKLLKF